MTDWISVKDRLPEWMKSCLCAVIVPQKGGGYSRELRILHISDTQPKVWNCEGMIVTHWMPLPEPPEEGEENAQTQ